MRAGSSVGVGGDGVGERVRARPLGVQEHPRRRFTRGRAVSQPGSHRFLVDEAAVGCDPLGQVEVVEAGSGAVDLGRGGLQPASCHGRSSLVQIDPSQPCGCEPADVGYRASRSLRGSSTQQATSPLWRSVSECDATKQSRPDAGVSETCAPEHLPGSLSVSPGRLGIVVNRQRREVEPGEGRANLMALGRER